MQAARNNNRRKQSVTLRLWQAEIGELSLCRHSIDHQPTHQTIYLPDQRHMHNIFNMLSSSIAFFMGYVLLGELNFAQRQSVTLPRQHTAYVDELRLRRHRPSVGVKNCKSQLARTTSSVRRRAETVRYGKTRFSQSARLSFIDRSRLVERWSSFCSSAICVGVFCSPKLCTCVP